MSGSPCFACRTETKERKLRHLTKWAGAAVRMGQQGGQTEALWTHLDPSKPEEQRIMPLTCPDARAVGCHAGTSKGRTIALWSNAKYFSLKAITLEKKKDARIRMQARKWGLFIAYGGLLVRYS